MINVESVRHKIAIHCTFIYISGKMNAESVSHIVHTAEAYMHVLTVKTSFCSFLGRPTNAPACFVKLPWCTTSVDLCTVVAVYRLY